MTDIPVDPLEAAPTARFAAGADIAVIGGDTLLLVSTDAPLDAFDRVRALVYADGPVEELLDAIAQIGLRQVPSLAVARREQGNVRIIVRGACVAHVRVQGESRRIEAGGVRTLAEQVVEGCEQVELVGADPGDGPLSYEAVRGTVPAGRLGWLTAADDVPAATPVDGPVSEPVPVTIDATDETVIDETVVDEKAFDGALDEIAAIPEPAPRDLSATIVGLDDAALEPLVVDDGEDSSDPVVVAPGPAAGAAAPLAPPSVEHPEDYDHLFGATRHITVENAAVRAPAEVAPPPEVRPTPMAPAVSLPDVRAGGLDAPSSALAADVPAAHPAVLPPPQATPGMIDGVPGVSAAPAVSSAPQPSVWSGSVASAAEAPAAGDHDGLTISAAELARLHGRTAGAASAPGAGASVPALHCPAGHPNPPTADHCRACHQPIPTAAPTMIARPSLGVLRLSSGTTVPIDRPLLIGRSPKLAGQLGVEVPHLVTVPSPDQAVSRNHIEVRLDGWHVLVVDLNSMNGTSVQMPGQRAQRLTPGSPFPIIPGAVVDLGGGVTCVYEVQ